MISERSRTVIALGSAQTLAWGSTYYLPAVIANAIARDMGISTSTVFAFFSMGLLVSGFAGPFSGRLIDRYGGSRVLPSSNVILALGLVLVAVAKDAPTLAVAWLVMGVGMSAGLYEAAFSTLARIYGVNARSAITSITLIAGFASTVCWPLTAWMSASFGWRDACFVWAAVHVFVCLPINLSLPPASAPALTTAASETTRPPPRMRLTMAALSFVFGVTWFCSTSMAAHLPRLLEMTGITQAAAIAAAALVGPSQVAARFVESMLMRRIGPLTSARIASLAHPVGAGTLLVFGAPATSVFTVIHGAGNGVMTIANGTLPLHLFGAAGYGLRQGLIMAPARVVQAAAPFLFDLAIQHYGVRALLLTMVMGLSSTVVLASLRSRSASP